jgi:hypothetical protein
MTPMADLSGGIRSNAASIIAADERDNLRRQRPPTPPRYARAIGLLLGAIAAVLVVDGTYNLITGHAARGVWMLVLSPLALLRWKSVMDSYRYARDRWTAQHRTR